jgi:hypothetical protein
MNPTPMFQAIFAMPQVSEIHFGNSYKPAVLVIATQSGSDARYPF